MRPDSAVGPTRSENKTVTWRRSARSSTTVSALGAAVDDEAFVLSSTRRAPNCVNFTAVPNDTDAQIFQVLRRQFGRTVSSISFSRNAASYRSRPRLRSQAPISIRGPRCHPRRGILGTQVDVYRCTWDDGSGSIRSFATPCRAPPYLGE